MNTIRLHTLKKYNSESGYFYVQREPVEYGTLVQRLSANFEITKSARLLKSRYEQSSFDAYSTDHGYFSTCRYHNVTTRRSLYCLLLDSKLETKANVIIKYENHKNFSEIQNINIKNMKNGGTLIIFSLKADHHSGVPIYLQYFKPDGFVTKAEEFGIIKCILHRIQIFEVNSSVYCVSVACDEMVHTRCVEIK